jgi:hypothetical protein
MFSDQALAAFRNFCQTAGLHQRHPLGQDQHELDGPGSRGEGGVGGVGGVGHAGQLLPHAQHLRQLDNGSRDQSTTGSGIPASAGAPHAMADQMRPRLQTSRHGTNVDQFTSGQAASALGSGGVMPATGDQEEPDETEAELRKFLAAQGLEGDALEHACNLAREHLNGGASDEPPDFTGRPNVGAGPNKPPQGGLRNSGAHDSALGGHIGVMYGYSPTSNQLEGRQVDDRTINKLLKGMTYDSREPKEVIARRSLSAAVNSTQQQFEKDCPFAKKVGFV